MDIDSGVEPIDFLLLDPSNNKRAASDATNVKNDTKSYGLKLRKSMSINNTNNNNNKQKRHHDKTLIRMAEQHISGHIGKNQRLGFVTFKE